LQLVNGHALAFGRGHIEAEQHGGGSIDRHRGGDPVERDPIEQRLHVVQAGYRHAALAYLTFRPRMVGVVSHQRGKVECHRETGLAPFQEKLVALVGVLGGAEPGELAHGPEPSAVHRGVNAPGVGVVARKTGRGDDIRGQVERGIHRLHRAAGDGGQFGIGPDRQVGGPGSPGGDLRPEPLQLELLLGDPGFGLAPAVSPACRHIRSPCFSSSSTSAASS
jgi:hypothetical protein